MLATHEMSKVLKIAFILFVTILPAVAEAQHSCELGQNIEIHQNDNQILRTTWTLENNESLFRTDFVWDSSLSLHKDWVVKSHPKDMSYNPIRALKHHRQLIADSQMEASWKKSELAKIDKMIEFGSFNIRSISCLEGALFEKHFQFAFPLYSYSEFGAIILVSSDRKKIRVHFITERSNQGSVSMHLLQNSVEQDQKRGFRLWMHLHSHPFDFENSYRDFAPIGPSASDLRVYLRDNFPLAIITDGISSFPMDRASYQAIQEAGQL